MFIEQRSNGGERGLQAVREIVEGEAVAVGSGSFALDQEIQIACNACQFRRKPRRQRLSLARLDLADFSLYLTQRLKQPAHQNRDRQQHDQGNQPKPAEQLSAKPGELRIERIQAFRNLENVSPELPVREFPVHSQGQRQHRGSIFKYLLGKPVLPYLGYGAARYFKADSRS